MKKTILQASELSTGYLQSKARILVSERLNLELFSGQLVCLIGPNGVGKSTLLRTLAGMQPGLEGEINIMGNPRISASNLELSKQISLVLTDKIPESNLSVFDLIALGRQPYTNWYGRLKKEDLKIIERCLAQTQLQDLSEKPCDQLSDGQMQRAMIARALAQDTPLIFLDEPTAHLDVLHKMETFHLLKKLSLELDRAVLISTHEIQLALETADEIWLMTKDGLIRGTPGELIDSGNINLMFDTDGLYFDAQDRRFKLRGQN